jgi:RNA polymerase sigma-70 factor (ECF subfamily)
MTRIRDVCTAWSSGCAVTRRCPGSGSGHVHPVFDKLSTFRGESAFATWVHRIAVTVTLNGLRKEKRLKRGADDLDVANDLPAPTNNVDPDLRAKLRAAIEALPPGSRASVILHDIEGYTHAEIGEMLGIAEGTSKAHWMQGRLERPLSM